MLSSLHNKSPDFKVNNSRIFLNTRFTPKANTENSAKIKIQHDLFNFFKLLPYLLGIIGIILIIAFVKYLGRDDSEYYDFDFESEVPIFHSKISEEEYQKHESSNENNFQETDEPFEVVWKQNSTQ